MKSDAYIEFSNSNSNSTSDKFLVSLNIELPIMHANRDGWIWMLVINTSTNIPPRNHHKRFTTDLWKYFKRIGNELITNVRVAITYKRNIFKSKYNISQKIELYPIVSEVFKYLPESDKIFFKTKFDGKLSM